VSPAGASPGGPFPPGAGRPGGRRGGRTNTAAEKLQARSVSLRRIGRLFVGFRGQLTVVTGIIVVSSVVSMASPFLLRAVIDQALPRRDVHLLVMLVSGMVAVAGVTSAFGVIQTWISTRVGQQIMHRLRTTVFAHLQRQSVGFFTQTRTGEVQSRITNDIGGMESVVTDTATSIAQNLTTVIATMVAMVALSWRLSLVSLLVLPPSIYLTRKVARMRREITAARQRELADLNVIIEEGLSISGVHLSKTMGTGSALIERFAASSSRLIDLELRSELAGRWRMASMSIIFAAIPAVLYLSAGLPGTAGTLSIGTVVAFAALQTGLFRPLMGLLNVGVSLTSSLALFARIFEYLDLPVEVDDPVHPVDVDPDRVQGHLVVEDVTFTYPGSATPAVNGVSLDVPAGTTLALVGETGSGKSTIAGLVSRLHDPTTGRITIDGIDLRDLRLADLSRIVGVVSQDTYLLHTSVRENLRYAKPDATDEELEEAARAAQIHDLIVSLPDGYDTVVGSRGYRFSGGEKQRIAIARTLLRNPRILVLDEATSALDTRTERAVQRAFDRLAQGRTTITIAHRLSTIRGAEQIVVISRGRAVESGTHETLVNDNGRYAALTGWPVGQPAGWTELTGGTGRAPAPPTTAARSALGQGLVQAFVALDDALLHPGRDERITSGERVDERGGGQPGAAVTQVLEDEPSQRHAVRHALVSERLDDQLPWADLVEAAPEGMGALVVPALDEAVGAAGPAIVVVDAGAQPPGTDPAGVQVRVRMGAEHLRGRGVELADDADERDLGVDVDPGLVGAGGGHDGSPRGGVGGNGSRASGRSASSASSLR
jgi:ATP-binding cassette subfamily B protein